MDIEFGTFVAGLVSDPLLVLIVILNLGVIIVNAATPPGWSRSFRTGSRRMCRRMR